MLGSQNLKWMSLKPGKYVPEANFVFKAKCNQGGKKSKQILFDFKLLDLLLYKIVATNTSRSTNTATCNPSSDFDKGDKTFQK